MYIRSRWKRYELNYDFLTEIEFFNLFDLEHLIFNEFLIKTHRSQSKKNNSSIQFFMSIGLFNFYSMIYNKIIHSLLVIKYEGREKSWNI